MSVLDSYLFFDGNCAEAMRFYEKTLGGKTEMSMTYGDSPDPEHCPPSSKDRIMHTSLLIDGERSDATKRSVLGPAGRKWARAMLELPSLVEPVAIEAPGEEQQHNSKHDQTIGDLKPDSSDHFIIECSNARAATARSVARNSGMSIATP